MYVEVVPVEANWADAEPKDAMPVTVPWTWPLQEAVKLSLSTSTRVTGSACSTLEPAAVIVQPAARYASQALPSMVLTVFGSSQLVPLP